MAVVSSATACAAITSHNTSGGSIGNLANCALSDVISVPKEPPLQESKSGGGLAEKFHGLTERFTSLGRSDSESCNRNRTGEFLNLDIFLKSVKNLDLCLSNCQKN